MPAHQPTISVVLGTVQGWSAVRSNIASFETAVSAVGGEVIVADGSRSNAPPVGELADSTRWLGIEGASVFQLRGHGYRMAKAPVVAISEDHCRVAPDWAAKMLAAHARHPSAAAVGGSVENGATGCAIDWASFLVVQSSLMTPIQSGVTDRIAGAVNVSYKRDSIEGIDEFDGLGTMDIIHQRRLRSAGRILIADNSIRVVHDQSLGWARTIRLHYHAGRTFAGFIRRRMDGQGLMRMLGVLVVPYLRFARAMRVGSDKGYGSILVRTWPIILWLYLVQAAGQIVGFAFGPGDSPTQVQ
jgi:hypothetical protein